MRDAEVNGRLVAASEDAPQVAWCPACGCRVRKRSRRRMDGEVTWYYRHQRGVGKNCPRRYSLT